MMSRMAKLAMCLLVLFCASCPTLTISRNLRFSEASIQLLDEPDRDAPNPPLFPHPFRTGKIIHVELHEEKRPPASEIAAEIPVELHEQNRPFVSEIGEASFTLDLISFFEENAPIFFAAEDGVAEPKLPSHIKASSIETILNQNGLPLGLLPSSVESYSLSDDGQFSVSLLKECYADFDYEVYYARKVTGMLSYGAISDLSGIQAKKAFIWLPVTGIHTDGSSSSYIYFDVGPLSKRLSISQFESALVCKAKAVDPSAPHLSISVSYV